MDTQIVRANRSLRPLAIATGIALIVFSAVGIGAFMGWIPSSLGGSAGKVAPDSVSASVVAPVPVPAASVSAKAATPAVHGPAPVLYTAQAPVAGRAAGSYSAPAPVADRPAAPYPGPAPVAENTPVPGRNHTTCAECGVIESVQEVDAKGAGTGLGAVGGAVAGGVLGHQIGGGKGKDLMTVLGAVGGGLAGNEVEKRMKTTKSYTVTVRLEDGTHREISETHAPTWRTGDRVRIVNGAIQSNG